MDKQPASLDRSVGIWGGAAIMVGIMIGSGIFRTPTSIAGEMGHPLLILSLWLVGGAICLCGAITYAELGTMFPRSGGIYVFLKEGFGPWAAFVFGWAYLVITQPMALGAMAMVFAEHLNLLLGTHLDTRVVTCVTILILTAINVRGMRQGVGMAQVLTGLKVLALALIVVLALVLLKGDGANFEPTPMPHSWLKSLVPVMAAILWTYDGWSDAAAVAEEIKEPQKRIPRIFMLGTAGTCLLYLAVNAVYMWMIPLSEMRESDTVAPLVMQNLIGDVGLVVVTVLIMVSTLGSTHASTIIGARIAFAQSRDGLLFSFLSRIHPSFHTPYVALWVQGVLACIAVMWLQFFETLIEGFVFASWIFYGLAAVAVFVLRVRRPDLPRPYRCWGYPVVPLVFLLAAMGMTILSILESPKDTLPWLGILIAGVPGYFVWRYFAQPATADPE